MQRLLDAPEQKYLKTKYVCIIKNLSDLKLFMSHNTKMRILHTVTWKAKRRIRFKIKHQWHREIKYPTEHIYFNHTKAKAFKIPERMLCLDRWAQFILPQFTLTTLQHSLLDFQANINTGEELSSLLLGIFISKCK